MATAATYTVVITALDKSTATINRVNQSFAKMTAPFAAINKSMFALGEAIGFNKFASAAANAGQKVSALGSQIGSILGPAAALGAIGSAAGLFEMAKSSAEWGHQLSLASEKTGVAVDALAKLHYAASVAGIGTEQMDTALTRLNKVIGDTASGHNKKALQLFREMHISLYNTNHTLKDAATLFAPVSEQFRNNASFSQKTAAANILFSRSYAELLPLLDMGSDKMRGLYATFEQMYGKITPQVIKAADEGEESFGRLKLATSGLKFAIGSALFPAMEKLITPLTGLIATNRKVISQNVGAWATQTAAYIKQIDWKGVGDDALGFARAVATVGRTLGPVWTTVAIAGVVFSPFIASTLGAAGALLKLGGAMGMAALRMAYFGATLIVPEIAAVIPVIGGLADAFAAFDLVLDANPIGAIVLGITALGAAGLALYEFWTPISGFFKMVWSGVVGVFGWAWGQINQYLPGAAIANSIAGHWGGITNFFRSLWNDVVGMFRWARNFAVGAWDYAAPVLLSAWNGVAGFFKGVWSDAVSVFKWAWKNIVPWVPGLNLVKLVIDNWKPITAFFSSLWKGVTAVFQKAWAFLKPIIDGVVGGAKWLLEHTGILDVAKSIGNVATGVTHTVVHVVKNVGAGMQAIEQHGAAIEAARAFANMPKGPGPIGVRLNNPLNMRAWGHNPLVATKSGNFAQFATPEMGVSAAAAQLQIYNRRGWNSLQSIISHWAPSSENNTGAYIAQVSKQMGVAPRAILNLNDAGTLQKLIAAMARHEQGGDKFASSVIAAGVNLRMGIPQPRMDAIARNSPAMRSTLVESRPVISRPLIAKASDGRISDKGPTDGKVMVSVDFKNTPRGTSVRTASKGKNPPALNTGVAWE